MSTHALNHVWNTSKAKGSALLVLVVLADNANDDGFSYYSLAKIAKKARLSPDQARKHIKLLEQLNEVLVYERKVIKDGAVEQYTNVYQVAMPGVAHQLPHLIGISETPRISSTPLAPMQVPPCADASTPLAPMQAYPSLYPSGIPSSEPSEEEEARARATSPSTEIASLTPSFEESSKTNAAQPDPQSPPDAAAPPLSPMTHDELYTITKRMQEERGLGFLDRSERSKAEVDQMYYQAVVRHPLYEAYITTMHQAWMSRRKDDGTFMTFEEVDNMPLGIEPRGAKQAFSVLNQLISINASPDQMRTLVSSKLEAGRWDYEWRFSALDIGAVIRADMLAKTTPIDTARGELFDAVARHIYETDPAAIPPEASGGRVGFITRWLNKTLKGDELREVGEISAPATVENVKAFGKYLRMKGITNPPYDLIKFVEQWRAWAHAARKTPAYRPVKLSIPSETPQTTDAERAAMAAELRSVLAGQPETTDELEAEVYP